MKTRTKRAKVVESDWTGSVVFDIRHYGAYGAPYDDTTAVIGAVKAAYAAGGGHVWIPRHLANASAFTAFTAEEVNALLESETEQLRRRIEKFERTMTVLVKMQRKEEDKVLKKQARMAKLYGLWAPKANAWVTDATTGEAIKLTGEHRKWLKEQAEGFTLSDPENPVIMKEYK